MVIFHSYVGLAEGITSITKNDPIQAYLSTFQHHQANGDELQCRHTPKSLRPAVWALDVKTRVPG